MEDSSSQFLEYTVRRRLFFGDKLRLALIWTLFLLGSFVFSGAFFLLSASFFAAFFVFILMVCLFLPILLGLSRIEYEYSLFAGEFRIAKIVGQRRRRECLEFSVLSVDRIAKRTSQSDTHLQNENFNGVYDFSSAQGTDLVAAWYLVYHGGEGEKYLVYFDMNEHLHRALLAQRRWAFSADK